MLPSSRRHEYPGRTTAVSRPREPALFAFQSSAARGRRCGALAEIKATADQSPTKHIPMNPEMNVAKIVDFYTNARKNSSVEDAATQAIEHLAITPSELVDAFNAAQLDLSRPDAEAKVIHAHRNELLSHFKTQE